MKREKDGRSHIRVLFHRGNRMHAREPRPCFLDSHIGPLVDRERFQAAGGVWAEMGICRACGSAISPSQLRRTIH